MSRRIQTSPASSSESARAIDLRPNASASVAVWWIALHALLAVALVPLGAPWVLEALALLAVGAHAAWRAPERPPRLVLRGDGRVDLPERGLAGLTLGPRTRFTAHWVRFDLRGGARRFDVILLTGQIAPPVWRELQSALRTLRLDDGNAARRK